MIWRVLKSGNPRFPFRISIERDGTILFAVRAQSAWPGAQGNVFCVRDGSNAEDIELFSPHELLPVVSFE